MSKLLFCGVIQVWMLNLEFEIVFEVCENIVEFWGIVVYKNEIGGVWGLSWPKGSWRLKEEEEKKYK